MLPPPHVFNLPCSSSLVDDAPTTARDKFGGQKAISSDMYFGRGSYDPVAQSEAQTRLQSFTGASSISSNQYFGREEDEMPGGPSGDGVIGDGTLSNLEIAAKDAISRVLANPDVQNAAESIRAGALKVGFSVLCYCSVLTDVAFAAVRLPCSDV